MPQIFVGKKIMEDGNPPKPEELEQTFEIEYEIGEDIPTFYANEMAVQTLYSEVILSFFEVRLPVKSKAGEVKAKGKCVGRIALPLSKVPDIIEALENQFAERLAIINRRRRQNGEAETNDDKHNNSNDDNE